jgi:hypothetical protein
MTGLFYIEFTENQSFQSDGRFPEYSLNSLILSSQFKMMQMGTGESISGQDGSRLRQADHPKLIVECPALYA